MLSEDERDALVDHFSSRARQVLPKNDKVLVPLKYDDEGELLKPESFDARKHLKSLTGEDWRFLECWRKNAWDVQKTKAEMCLPEKNVEKLVKKLEVFKDEEARDLALATIPSTQWVQARHVENIFGGGTLGDSERDSLKELAKISGAYKTAANTVNIQQNNIFHMPKLTPEAVAKLREFADGQADVIEAKVA